ncbi:WD40-repeat-containing domain protein, partial [Fomitopsis serialis]|uniref:WD40-repeat-containing domain protein n=1 Tax=Fomitopsis serialis TaxID=139415 RepID=UPI0020079493
VAFSPSGLSLASGSLDGCVCVWDIASSTMRYAFAGKSTVLSMIWAPPNDGHIVCGMADGTIASLTMTKDTINVSGFWAHEEPVESLAYDGTHLASGAHEELKVWLRTTSYTQDTWTEVADVEPPPRTSLNATRDVIVTSLHWTTTRRRPSVLVATYMNHGISIIDGRDWKRVRSVAFPGYIADADLSADGQLLVVSNMLTGFEVFNFKVLTELEPLCSFNQDNSTACTMPVRFIHGGQAVVGGTLNGCMSIWDIHT